MARGLERIPLAVDSDFKYQPVRANFPEQSQPEKIRLVGFEPDPTPTPEPDDALAEPRSVIDDVVDDVVGIGKAAYQGAFSTGRTLGAASNTYLNNLSDVELYAKAQNVAAGDSPAAKKELMAEIERRKAANPDGSAVSKIGDVLGAAANNKMGTAQFIAEQAPNTIVSLGSGLAFAKGGAALGFALGGPAGSAILGTGGFLAGMFLGNTLLETGGKAMEKAKGGFTADERGEAIREGAIKGGVITGVDAATLGAGGLLTKSLNRAAIQAGARAEAQVLADAGVDLGSRAAVEVALASNKALRNSAMLAGQKAASKASTLSRRAIIGGTGLTMETVGEGGGEYLGELAATGKADIHDAALEALAGFTQSSVETAWNMRKSSGNDLDAKGIVKERDSVRRPPTMEGEFVPAENLAPEDHSMRAGDTFDQLRPGLPPEESMSGDVLSPEFLPPGQRLLPSPPIEGEMDGDPAQFARPALPAPEQGGPTERQIATARGLLAYSPKASPELLMRLMRVDSTMATMLFNQWKGKSDAQIQVKGQSALQEMPQAASQGGGLQDQLSQQFKPGDTITFGDGKVETIESIGPDGWVYTLSGAAGPADQAQHATRPKPIASSWGNEFSGTVAKQPATPIQESGAPGAVMQPIQPPGAGEKAIEPTNSLGMAASWVIRNKETGEVVMETFDRKKVEALNTAKYEAVPIGTYLSRLNKDTNQVSAQDAEAHAAATSPFNAIPQPTEAQKQAGNYKKGHLKFQGLDISIENPAGSVRSGKDSDGREWHTKMQHHYGYIKGTVGRDKDHLDVFIKPNAKKAGTAYVVDQIDPKTGRFDEHKIVFGADSAEDARAIYQSNYEEGWQGIGEITAMPMTDFKAWLKSGKTKKPIAYVEPKQVRTAARRRPASDSLTQAIINRGGISREIMSDVGADPKGRYQPGLFTNSGTTDLSELAELLFIEDGFHQIDRNSDIGPARELEELISRAIRGERILNTEATEREYQQGLEAKKRAEIDRLANEYGVALKDGGKRRSEDAIEADLEDAIAFEIKKAGEAFAGMRNAALAEGITEDRLNVVEEMIANSYDGDNRRDYMILMYRDLANAIQEKIDEQVLRSKDWIQREEGAGARQDAGVSEAAKGASRATGEGREEPFSLSSQTEGDLAAKAAREADETLANKALADSQREAFTLSYPEGSAAPKAVPSKQTGLFAADGSAKASAIAGKPVAEMSDDQLRNIARGLSPTYGDAAVDKAKTELRRRDEAPKAKQTPADAGVSVSKPEKVSAGETATDFIRAPDGSIDFGEITDEQARVIRRQAGKIRLERGWHDASTHKGSGLVHVEARHGKQIRDLGYASVEKFISDAVHQINEVWKPDATAQMVAIVNDRHGRVIFVELQPARDEAGDYYTIRSAFPVSQGYAEQKEKSEGWALLWPKSPVLEAAPGSQTDSVGNSRKSGESAPMAIGQSSGGTLAQSINQRNTEKVGAGEAASDRDSFTLAEHAKVIGHLRDGAVTLDEFKAAFEAAVSGKDAIKTELSAMTKDALLKQYPQLAYSYKNNKKADIVNAAYRSMLNDFVLGDSISYSMGQKYEDVIRGYVDKTTEESLREFADKAKAANEERIARHKEAEAGMENPVTLDDYKRILAAKAQEIGEGATFGQARMAMTPEQRAKFDELTAEKSRNERKARADQQRTDVRVAATTAEGQIVETKHTKTGEPLFVVKAAERVERDVYNQWNATAKKLGGYYSSFRGNGAVPGFQFKTRENANAFLEFIGGKAEKAQETVQARRDAFADDKSQSAVERLREMAERIDERADESLGRDRQANTARRARFAASAEAAANGDKAMAQTMRNIAQAIESGDAKFLDRVRQKAQIEMLTSLVSSAQWDYWKAKYPTYAEQERHKGERPVQEVADYAQFPQYTAFRSDLAKLGRQMIEIDGAKKLGQRLLAVADDVTDAYLEFAKENLHKVSTFKRSDGGMAQFASKGDAETAISRSGYKGKAIVLPFKRGQNIIIQSPAFARENGLWTGDDDKRITLNADFGAELVAKSKEYIRPPFEVPGSFNYVADKLARLKALGIETPAEFRAMLREFIGMKQAPKAPDRIKELERSMVGRAKDGLDFFPTPAGAVQDMLDAAELQEGMSVLEPSAGMGHIADLIREAGVEPDVVELSNERKELLEAKGYNIVGRDFMELKPDDWTFGDTYSAEDGTQGVLRGGNRERVRLVGEKGETLGYFNREDLTPVQKNGGGYDRIIMNPPFGDRRDAQHVRHAFDLLAPGGRLVAIMGEGVFFGQDKKATAFREWLESVGGSSEKLEDGTFLDPSLPVNTGTSARLVVIDKSKKGMESRAALKPVDTASPEFKRWFGDWEDPKAWSSKARAPVSMAVDWKTKKPLKLFHATNSDFSAFDVGRPTINSGTFGDIETSRAGIFATPDAQFASEYLRAGSGQNIMPIYMRLVSPMDMRDGLDWQHISDIVSNSNGGITESDFRHIEPTAAWKLFDGDFGRRFVDAARRAGYDGAIIREESSNSGDNHDVYVAFSPTQIKSAIGNTGGFSDSNPSILESRASADDLQFASDVLAQLGDDEYFRWPVSKSADLRTVFKEVYPGAKYFGEHTRADERDETGADHRHVFVNHLGKRFHVYTRDNGSVWLDVSQLANSDGGNQIYAAVANWAHNAGFKFQGDPVGVSADAVIRRTVNMLSSALRFGTTKHLDAAREQAKGDPDNGVEPLKWGSNDVENVRELIHTFTTTLFNKFPGLARYHYDFNRKDFFDKNGERVSPDRFREGAEKDQARDARAGEATLRRGVFLKSLISSESSERPGILATVLKLHGARTLGGLRQFLSKTTPAQAGVSVSGDTNTIRDVVDRFRSEFKGAAALDIRVVNSTAEIPAHYRPSLYAEGVFHDDAGLIYLVARNLQDRNGKPNTARAFQVLLHEAVGHFGLSKMMGERFSRITARVKEAARAKGEVKDDIYQPGHPDYATIEAVRLRYPDATEDEVAQEVLARMAETDPGRTLFGYIRAMVRQWVRDTARALGIDLNITTKELNDLVALASAYMRRGDNLAEDQASSGIVAASRAQESPKWFSQLAKAFSDAKMNALPADQWLKWLTSNADKMKVKKDEIQWTGITDWLDLQQGKITKEQVMAFLGENGVQVQEVVLGMSRELSQSDKERLKALWMIPEYERTQAEQAEVDALEAEQIRGTSTEATKFSDYQLPGGENYRELLLTLPSESDVRYKMQALQSEMDIIRQGQLPENLSEAARARFYDVLSDYEALKKKRDTQFRSSHFDQPNILAHVRFNERTDADGKRVLFLEELQSDWAQKGRKQGFGNGTATKEDIAGFEKDGWHVEERNPGQFAAQLHYTNRRGATAATEQGAWDALMRNESQGTAKVPSAPFVTKTEAWTALALKRMIRYAAENGFDKIAWTTGEQQADRYDLSKQVKEIIYAKSDDGKDVMLDATRPDGGELFHRKVAMQELPDIVGKEVAQKIADGKRTGKLSGLDLKVGGEGMKGYYDKIVPSVANDILKKMGGGKVEPVSLSRPARAERKPSWTMIDTSHQSGDVGIRPGFTITDAILEKAMGGMPLFSKRSGMESRRTISGNSGRAYTAEQQAAFRNVGREVETPTFKERVAGLWRDIGKKMEQGIADQFAPLKDLDKDAYLLARMSKGADGALEAMLMYGKVFIRDGVYDVDVKDGGVIDKLLRPLGKEADDFLWWVAGNRAADLAKQGRENLMSGNDIKALQDLAAGKLDFDYTLPNGQATRDRATAYAAAQKVFAEFNKSVLDIAEQSGLIDGQARAVWESDFYVPFYRDMDGDKPTFPNVKSGLVRQKAFERLKGGDEKLHSDLLANTILNWSHLLHAAAKNRAAKAALEAAEKVGAATWIPVTENGAVSYRDGGDEYFYRVDDPFVLDAVTALEFSGFSGPAMKAMGAFKRWLTIGVTASPTFKVRNLIRDSISAIGTAELSYNLAKNLKQGYAATGRDSQTYASMLAGGGHIRFGAMIEGNRSDHVRRLVEKGVDPDTILDDPSKLKRVWSRNVMPLIDAWNEIGDRSENINRAAIYEQLRAKGMSHADASLAARDLLDFSMGGTWAAVRFLTAVVPFANARIQGLYKLGRAAKDDPKRLGYVAGAVALASLALLAAGYDDDDWKKREDWDRDTYWWFKIGGVAFRIPKPFEIGAIGTLAERSAELLFDKEMDGQRFGDRIGNMVLNTFAMNPVPQMFKPLIDLYANRDSFTGRSIESMGMEKVRPEDRFTMRSSEFAKLVGKANVLSPVQVDHMIRGYFGWLGTAATTSVDSIVRLGDSTQRPARELRDMFLIGSFIETLPSGSSRYVTQMYEQSKEIEEAYNSWKKYRKIGDTRKADEIYKDSRDLIQKYRLAQRAKQMMTRLNAQSRRIEADGSLNSEEKRNRLRKIAAQKDRVARIIVQ